MIGKLILVRHKKEVKNICQLFSRSQNLDIIECGNREDQTSLEKSFRLIPQIKTVSGRLALKLWKKLVVQLYLELSIFSLRQRYKKIFWDLSLSTDFLIAPLWSNVRESRRMGWKNPWMMKLKTKRFALKINFSPIQPFSVYSEFRQARRRVVALFVKEWNVEYFGILLTPSKIWFGEFC